MKKLIFKLFKHTPKIISVDFKVKGAFDRLIFNHDGNTRKNTPQQRKRQ
jgi:hypothetical protein